MHEVLLDVIVLYECGTSYDWTVEVLGHDSSEPQFVVISVKTNIDLST